MFFFQTFFFFFFNQMHVNYKAQGIVYILAQCKQEHIYFSTLIQISCRQIRLRDMRYHEANSQ